MTIGLAVVLAAAACGGGAAPPPPAPQPNQDSIEAARREQATRDSIAREQARRDSAARAQAEADRIRRQRESDSLQALAREGDAVKAMIARAVHFDFDKSNIRPGEDTEILDEKLRVLQANPGLTLEITGHADERGSDEYNLALGNRRALSAKQYLTGRGIDAGRLTTKSMGEEQPVDPAQTEDAWAKNRRDEFTAGGSATLRRP
ncbi:MAG: OmpA family protein [Gemmatimonadetes bacterium]|nr:OmpA family protein [Gemmatimonadota bacterium]